MDESHMTDPTDARGDAEVSERVDALLSPAYSGRLKS
jgi:hypothetical protein